MILEIILSLLAMLFWISISLTEGWKWRKDEGRPDNNSLITYESYHVWRFITNGCWISVAILMSFVNNFSIVVSFLLANCVGWIMYERLMAFVQYDKLTQKKPEFYIAGLKFKRPKVEFEVAFGAAALVALIVNIFALK